MYGEFAVNCRNIHDILDSVSIDSKPIDYRCRHWIKIIRHDQDLPMPIHVTCADDIPGKYYRNGSDIEIYHGDMIFEGEENHHRKMRGWTMTLGVCRYSEVLYTSPDANHKALIKACPHIPKEMRKALVQGSGSHAAMIRIAHAMRWMGVSFGSAYLDI